MIPCEEQTIRVLRRIAKALEAKNELEAFGEGDKELFLGSLYNGAGSGCLACGQVDYAIVNNICSVCDYGEGLK